MSMSARRPISILTLLKIVTEDKWTGQVPVKIRHASNHDELMAMLPGTDVLIYQVFTREMTRLADSLKLIQSIGAGYERIDLAAVPPGCQVAIAYEHERAIGEWIVMAMIALNRDAMKGDRALRRGNWEYTFLKSEFPPELSEQTLGIIGLGHIGREAASLARFFGMRVIAATRTVPSPDEIGRLGLARVAGIDGLDRVLTESDFFLLATPVTASTKNMIGARELALMKPTAHLINVARADVVDQGALYKALKERRIRGAALDVWYHEPNSIKDILMPADYPFWELDNVLMTPHLAGVSTGLLRRRLSVWGRNVDNLAQGKPLENVVHVGS